MGFYEYCKNKIPKLDKINKSAKQICYLMENHTLDKGILLLRMPPKSGKTLFCRLFVEFKEAKTKALIAVGEVDTIQHLRRHGFNSVSYNGSCICHQGIILDGAINPEYRDWFYYSAMPRATKYFPLIVIESLGLNNFSSGDLFNSDELLKDNYKIHSFSAFDCFNSTSLNKMNERFLGVNGKVYKELFTQARTHRGKR